MHINDWPMDRIMEMPDSVFGRRWLVGVAMTLTDANPVFDISEFALPDRFILWEIVVVAVGTFSESVHFGLSLGDIVPTTETEFDALEIILGGSKARDGEIGEIEVLPFAPTYIRNLRQPVAANGRRLVGKAIRDLGAPVGAIANITISSVPREAPAWLNSEHRNGL